MGLSFKEILQVHGENYIIPLTVRSGKTYTFDMTGWKFLASENEDSARKTANHAATELIHKWNRDNGSWPIEGENYSDAMAALEAILLERIMAITRYEKDQQLKTKDKQLHAKNAAAQENVLYASLRKVTARWRTLNI
jgi:hypothetical protein